jgi:hypothetical protein
MDRDAYRVTGYSEAELQLMVDQLDDLYGTTGALTQQGFQDFADGVNQYIMDTLTDLCNGQDANAVKRAALGQPGPTFGQNCHNATGEPLPPGI